MRISDWSSDVCSSDLWPLVQPRGKNTDELAPPHFAIIAYGKLGGKEIGYASDLDLVFLYDDANDDASELYTKLGRRMASWLSTMTSSGRLYEIDLRLRPDGDARSEEHTSELQSLMRISYAVFCLTKKTHKKTHKTENA